MLEAHNIRPGVLHGGGRYFCLVLALLIARTIPALATEPLVVGVFTQPVKPSGVPAGWELKQKSGRADFRVDEHEGVSALRLTSDSASFSFQREVNVDLTQTPVLTWKWKVTKLPEGGDFRKSRTDDQAAQLFVAFNKRQSIVYLWETTAPKGMIGNAAAPPFMSIKAVVLRSGKEDTGKWVSESRNIYEDYRRLYAPEQKAPAVKVSGLRLQINSQHTRTPAESYFADLVFKPR